MRVCEGGKLRGDLEREGCAEECACSTLRGVVVLSAQREGSRIDVQGQCLTSKTGRQ